MFVNLKPYDRWKINYYYILLQESFSQRLLINFHWSLSDSKSSRISRILLSIPANLNSGVVWMVSTLPVIFKSSTHFNNLSVTVPRVPIIIGIIVTFMFHNFFSSLARSMYLSFLLSFNFTLWSTGTAKKVCMFSIFFLLIIIRFGHLVEIRWSVCMLKSHWSFSDNKPP